MPRMPAQEPDHHDRRVASSVYDPDALDALSQRHAELLRELQHARAQLAQGEVASALEQLMSFDVQLRGFIATHDAVLLKPLSIDWRNDPRAAERIARSRLRWHGIASTFEEIAAALAAIGVARDREIGALDFRFAEASHRLGAAFREDRASLFLLYLSPTRAPQPQH